MHLYDMASLVTLENLNGSTVINGMVQPSCGYSIYFRSLQQTGYDFSLYFWRGLHKPEYGGVRYCLSATLMENIINSPSVRPAPMKKSVGSFEISEGYASEVERKRRYLNELDFRISGSQDDFVLRITGKTYRPYPDSLSNWDFDITIKLSREMVQSLSEVSLNHDA